MWSLLNWEVKKILSVALDERIEEINPLHVYVLIGYLYPILRPKDSNTKRFKAREALAAICFFWCIAMQAHEREQVSSQVAFNAMH